MKGVPQYLPRRDDAVAAWLKQRRDEANDIYRNAMFSPEPRTVIDRLLDEYREKSDYGLRLDEDGGDT